MVGSDRGEDAYHRENKMTTMTLLSSLSSLVSLHCVLAMSLTVTRSYSSVESLVVLGLWVHMALSSVGTGYVVVGGRWSFNSRCWWDEEVRCVTICDTCDFGINVPTRARDRAWITLTPKFVVYTVL